MIGLLSPEEYYTAMGRGPILDHLYRIGQFFWAPSLFLFGERQTYLVRSSYTPTLNDYEYRIDRMRRDEFDSQQELNYTLGIRSDERAVIVGAKRRPVILISRESVRWADARRSHAESFLVAPLYSFGGDETKQAYSRGFIERSRGTYTGILAVILPASVRRRHQRRCRPPRPDSGSA